MDDANLNEDMSDEERANNNLDEHEGMSTRDILLRHIYWLNNI